MQVYSFKQPVTAGVVGQDGFAASEDSDVWDYKVVPMQVRTFRAVAGVWNLECATPCCTHKLGIFSPNPTIGEVSPFAWVAEFFWWIVEVQFIAHTFPPPYSILPFEKIVEYGSSLDKTCRVCIGVTVAIIRTLTNKVYHVSNLHCSANVNVYRAPTWFAATCRSFSFWCLGYSVHGTVDCGFLA